MPEKLTFTCGSNSSDLDTFIRNFWSFSNMITISARNERSTQLYEKMKRSLGQEGLAKIIRDKMNGNDMILLSNEYPYDVLIPKECSLKHFCLWAVNEKLLTEKVIRSTIEQKFPSAPFFVFIHDDQLSSIKLVPHAHIIIDFQMSNEAKFD